MGSVTSRRLELPTLGFSTRLLERGEGPPVLLLHGNPDSAFEWERLIGLLDGRRCLAPDLPGFGESEEPPPEFGYSAAAHGRFLDAVLEGCAVRKKLVLVVHDIGGVVGLPWAASNLGRLAGVVVTNTAAFEDFHWFAIARTWGDTTLAGSLRAQLGMLAIGLGGGSPFRKLFGRLCPELPPSDLERMTREFALAPIAKRSTLRLFRQMVRPGFFDGYRRMLEMLTASVPTWVVWGEPDPFIPARYAHEFGSASVEILSGAGHWVPLTASEAVARAIRAVSGREPLSAAT
jgi:pimeloyl-ACP methyl ester carboxylesterase